MCVTYRWNRSGKIIIWGWYRLIIIIIIIIGWHKTDILLMCYLYMVYIWQIYGWHMAIKQLMYRRYVTDINLIYSWYRANIWLIEVDIHLINGLCRADIWLNYISNIQLKYGPNMTNICQSQCIHFPTDIIINCCLLFQRCC